MALGLSVVPCCCAVPVPPFWRCFPFQHHLTGCVSLLSFATLSYGSRSMIIRLCSVITFAHSNCVIGRGNYLVK